MLRDAAPTFFVHLDAPFEVLEQRMQLRTKHFMPTTLLSRSSTRSSSSTTTSPAPSSTSRRRVDEVVEEAVNAVRVHYTE